MILSLIFAGNIGSYSDGYIRQATMKDAVNALFNKREIISKQYTGEPSDDVWNGEKINLQKTDYLVREDGKDFVILNLSDPHFADYDYRAFLAFNSTSTVKKLVEKIKPDLITVTGDIVCTKSDIFAIKRFTDLMESFDIPWALVFGNHDDEGNCDLNYLCDIMMKSPHCLLRKGDPEMGVGNYAVRILNSDGTTAQVLIMLDSHHSQLNQKQTDWVCAISDEVRNSGNADISLFFHVPLPEYQYAFDEANINGKWKDGFNAAGELHESVACERNDGIPVQRGIFDRLKTCGNIKHIFCGHDHMNDYSVEYQGIRLTYCMKLGFGSGFQPGFNGGTVISVGNDGITGICHKARGLFGIKDILSINGDK